MTNEQFQLLLEKLKNEPYQEAEMVVSNIFDIIHAIQEGILNGSENSENDYKIALKERVESCLERIKQNPNNENYCSELAVLIAEPNPDIFEDEFKKSVAYTCLDIISNLEILDFDTDTLAMNCQDLYRTLSVVLKADFMQENIETLKSAFAKTIYILGHLVAKKCTNIAFNDICEFIEIFPMGLIGNKQQLCFKLLTILRDNKGSLAESSDQLYEKIIDMLEIIEADKDILQEMQVILNDVEDPHPDYDNEDTEALVDLREKLDTLLISVQLAGVQEGDGDIVMDEG